MRKIKKYFIIILLSIFTLTTVETSSLNFSAYIVQAKASSSTKRKAQEAYRKFLTQRRYRYFTLYKDEITCSKSHLFVLYEYQKTRNASHPRNFLKDYTGICVTDGYQVYHTLEKEREDLRIAGCWVHCRRRFYDALEVIPKAHQKESILHLFIKQIQAIYREEGKLAGLSSEERLAQRQLVVKPLVDAFFAYLK